MTILLDTHVFLWAIGEPRRLSKKIRTLLESDVVRMLSAASLWEIALKVQAGKLEMAEPTTFLRKHMTALKVATAPVRDDHVLRTFSLPQHHKDPFDRLIVAQALTEDWPIMTEDAMIARYAVDIIW
jgi:PIN domain nuclease of toxin-antitoxin system